MKEKLHWPKTLEFLIKQREIKPAELAREIKVSHVAVGNYLKGAEPGATTLKAIADYLGTTADWLISGDVHLPFGGSERGETFEMREVSPEYGKNWKHEHDRIQKELLDLKTTLRQLAGPEPPEEGPVRPKKDVPGAVSSKSDAGERIVAAAQRAAHGSKPKSP